MLRPFLLIGIGGSGGKTLRIVRHELQRRLAEHGWDPTEFPAGWRFLHIDVPSVADGDDSDLPAQLPQAEYVGLVSSGVNYRNIDAALAGAGRSQVGDWIAGWRPDPAQVTVPVERGAGQFRALGRMLTLANLKIAKAKLDDALRDINGRDVTAELQELTRRFGGTPSSVIKPPVAVIVSSIAGGSGAGAVIDIADLLRASAGVWASESIGILYSPDVFDYLPPQRRRGVRPNALATLSELVAGYWNKSGPSEATTNILNRQGVAVGDTDRLGPRYSFLVGSKNDYVTYRTQNDIYQAMGRSISSWVTSGDLQDRIDAYVSGNWAPTAVAVEDGLGLNTNEMETPFSALGSARVGLGRDRFRDFAAERLARAAVERLLNRHEEQRQRGDERPSHVIAQEAADTMFGAFLANSRLNERTEQKNDILDAIRPKEHRDAEMVHLKNQLFASVTSETSAKGRPVQEWRVLIASGVRNVIDRQLDSFEIEDREYARKWVKDIQSHLRTLAASTLALDGYLVTAMLFRKLVEELRAVQTELEQEMNRYLRHGDNIDQQVEEALRKAGGDVLPQGHPQVDEAVKRGVAAIHFRSEARLRQLVISLLPDLTGNLILPMAEEIDRAGQALSTETQPTQGQPSAISSWPDDDEVPARLSPAANEFLLEPLEGYGARLNDLVSRTAQVEDRIGAMRGVVQRVIVGADDITAPDQSLVRQPSHWTPKQHELYTELSTPSRASFEVRMSAQELLGRATQWLTKPGTPAGNYVTEGLDHYLDPDQAEPQEHSARLNRFESQLAASIDAAQPLVSIKKSVLVAVHQRNEAPSETFFTELPFSPNSPAAKVVRRVLESKGRWSADVAKAFVKSDRPFIDAFSVLTEPYEPVVFDSLMRPIAQEWGDRSKTADGREEFWRWRRGRSLPEFIPAAPAVRRAMVRGWFTATMLAQITMDDLSVRIFKPNPVGGNGSWLSFPEPLLAPGVRAAHDYLPLALESLPLAFVEIAVDANIAPIMPYRRLRSLGTSGEGGLESYESPNRELTNWIDKGVLPQGAPTPDPANAGSSDQSMQARKDAIVSRVEALCVSYGKLFAEQERRTETAVTRAYELEADITAVLNELAQAVREHDVAASGADQWN
jgi:hypothetical protein